MSTDRPPSPSGPTSPPLPTPPTPSPTGSPPPALPAGTTFAYDAASRLVGVVDARGQAARYRYDAVGNVTAIERFPASQLSILSFTPVHGSPGRQVTITGTGFRSARSENTVRFNGAAAQVTGTSPNRLVVVVPSGAGSGAISVTTTAGTASSTQPFTIDPVPAAQSITGVSPALGVPGTTVTISGTGFHPDPNRNVVMFNRTRARITTATATSLTVTVPHGAGSGRVSVAGASVDQVSISAGDFIIPPRAGALAAVESAGRLSIGGASQTVGITSPDRVALRLFDGRAGQHISVGATGETFTNTFEVALFTPFGQELGHELFNSDGGVTFYRLPIKGTYQLLIKGAFSSSPSTGQALVTLSDALTSGTLTTTASGASVLLGGRPGQAVRLIFAGRRGQRLSLGLTTDAVTLSNLRVSVFQPAGSSLMFRHDAFLANEDLDLPPLPMNGSYEVIVSPEGAGSSQLTVTLSEQIDGGLLSTTAAGTSVGFRPGQNAELRFAGTTGQRMSVGLVADADMSPLKVLVLRPDGSMLVEDSLIGRSDDVDLEPLPVSGTYRFVVNPTGGGRLTVTLSQEQNAGTLTVGGTGVPLSIARPGQNARLAFTGSSGQRLTLALGAAVPNSILLSASVFRPDGTALAGPRLMRGGEALDLPGLPAAGTYQVLIDPHSAATGTLTVQVRPTALRASGFATSAAPASLPGGGLPELRGPRGATALGGQVRTLDGMPLPDVTLRVGERATKTDQYGRFLLSGVPAGHQELLIDGRSAGRRYGTFEAGVDLARGRTTLLPYTIWMPRLDTAHTTSFESPARRDVVVSTPSIPGLEVHLPKGSVVKDHEGRTVRSLGITAIPVDRPPFPLPKGVQVPVYFTVQPGGSYIYPAGARIIYPNYTKAPPGRRMEFWAYDPEEKGWHVYGHGSVSPDGKRVVPDPGVRVWEFTGAMINTQTPADVGPTLDPYGAADGDPVDLGTGLMVNRHTDLMLPDTLPVALTRVWRQAYPRMREFGRGQTHIYSIFPNDADLSFQSFDLVLPDSGRVRFRRITPGRGREGVWEPVGTPSEFAGSTLAWNGNGWDLTTRDGVVLTVGFETPLQAIRDRHGTQITLSDDRAVQTAIPDQIISPNGKWIRLTYDGELGRVLTAEDNIGRIVRYGYDAGRLTSVTDPAGGVITYAYNEADQLTSITDARNIVCLRVEYDAAGRVSRQIQADGGEYRFAYTTNAAGNVIESRVTDPRGHVRRVTFNDQGFVTSDTRALGTAREQRITFFRAAGASNVTTITDALGRITRLVHDTAGRVAGITRLAGTSGAVTRTMTYGGPIGQLSSVTDPLGHTTTFAYDTAGNLASVTDPVSRTTRVELSADDGQVLSVTDNRGRRTRFSYRFGELVGVTDPLGRRSARVLDSVGRVLEVRDPLDNTTRLSYDVLNQVRSVTGPQGGVTRYDYDPNGNVLSVTDALNRVTRYSYDAMDRLDTITDPLLRVARYDFDLNGNLTQVTNRRNQITRMEYDELDRPTATRYGSESSTVRTYDLGDRVTGISDSADGTITYTLDRLDRITSEQTPRGTIGYAYDDAGRRTQMTTPGDPPTFYVHNDADQLTGVIRGGSGVAITYTAAGERAVVDLPGATAQASAYDNAGRLTTLVHSNGDAVLRRMDYSYDEAGRPTFVTANHPAPPPMAAPAYNANDQLVRLGSATLSYDNDGNLTSDGTTAYTWNARGQLSRQSRTGLTATFRYDGLDRRVGTSINGTSTGFLHDGPNVVQELSGSVPTTSLLTGGIDEYFSRSDAVDTRSFLTDALGSTVALAGTDGAITTTYAYGPYGRATSSGPAGNRYQYTGREDDGTGLVYYRARYYNPGIGRFISEDPIGLAAGTNPYPYAANSPTTLTDPMGTNPIFAKCAIGAIQEVGMAAAEQSLGGRKIDLGLGGIGSAILTGCLDGVLGAIGTVVVLGAVVLQNLRPGNTAAAVVGQAVHHGPAWSRHLDSLGYTRGGPISSNLFPDGFTRDGFPVELKPDTWTGTRAGTRQLRKYMKAMGVDYGELWTYEVTPNGASFRVAAIPKGRFRWIRF